MPATATASWCGRISGWPIRVDGPDPDDNAMFLAQRARLRSAHPQPPFHRPLLRPQRRLSARAVESGLRRSAGRLHPGIHYIPSSADDVVSGHGPYRAMPPQVLLRAARDHQAAQRAGHAQHRHAWTACEQMMPERSMWPQGDVWGMHDFTPARARRAAHRSATMIDKSYGGADNVDGLGRAGAVHQLRRLPRHVRSAEQEPHGRAALDEPSVLAVASCGRPTTITSTRRPATSAPRRAPSRCTSSGTR